MAAPDGYAVKWIDFLGTQRPILCQAQDGPCPLLAVANVFLLLGRLALPPGSPYLAHTELVNALGHYLQTHPLGGQGPDAEFFVAAALECLTKLAAGLIVDPIFSGPLAFHANPGADFFENSEIRLCHAWVLDAAAAPPELVAQLADAPSHEQASARAATLGEDAGAALAAWVQLPEQATVHGVRCVARCLRNLELATLFRAKHFSVVFKRCCCPPRHVGACACPQSAILLCELLTSTAYLAEPAAVWQTLEPTEVCLKGAATILGANFEPPRGVQLHMPQREPPRPEGAPEGAPDDWDSMPPAERKAFMAALTESKSSASSPSSSARSAAAAAATSAQGASSSSGSSGGGGGGGGGGSRGGSSSQGGLSTSAVGKHDRTRQQAMTIGAARLESMARQKALAAAGGGGGSSGAGGPGGGGAPSPPPQQQRQQQQQQQSPGKDKGCSIC